MEPEPKSSLLVGLLIIKKEKGKKKKVRSEGLMPVILATQGVGRDS
jgi:hypothetical protein